MIIGDYGSLMVHLEKAYIPGYTHDAICPLGYFSFNIDDKLYPSNFFHGAMELYNLIDKMQRNLEKWLATNPPDFNLGCEEITQMQIDGCLEALDDDWEGDTLTGSFFRYDENLFELTRYTELADIDFCCFLGFQADKDRLFYSVEFINEKPWHYIFNEITYPHGTVVDVIRALPKSSELETIEELERNGIYRSYTRTKI
ncbi:MAG: hypothetical protein IJ566_07335 [Cardiobacteriaceae bacterium]|nr:hypothetical protein [Cardiobacteriaceae bacterium]